MKGILAGFALLLGTTPVFAAGQGGSWYLGGGGGQSSFRDICSHFEGQSLAGSCDDKSAGWKIFVGHDISKHFGWELSYTEPGEAKIAAPSATPGTLEVHPWIVNVSAKLEIPFATVFTVFGKVGASYFNVDYKRTGSFRALNSGDDGLEPSVGAGVGVRMSRRFGVRFEWENFKDAVGGLGDGNIDLVTANILYNF